jgi:hypothetical protein
MGTTSFTPFGGSMTPRPTAHAATEIDRCEGYQSWATGQLI